MTEARALPRILASIRATKEAEVQALLARRSLAALEAAAQARIASDPPRDFLAALLPPADRANRADRADRASETRDVPAANDVPAVIAEVKKASPSKGVIRPDFDPPAIARAYAAGGAACISCLTDREYFQGELAYLEQVRAAAELPVLRKDFLIHEAQILEARAHGADAVLLIARMLEGEALDRLYRLARGLGMAVLLEVHDEPDLEKALATEARLIGVNNRDLDTFVVDVETTFRLRETIPPARHVVGESGLESPAQLRALHAAGVAAVLVGESLMRQPDPAAALRALRGME